MHPFDNIKINVFFCGQMIMTSLQMLSLGYNPIEKQQKLYFIFQLLLMIRSIKIKDYIVALSSLCKIQLLIKWWTRLSVPLLIVDHSSPKQPVLWLPTSTFTKLKSKWPHTETVIIISSIKNSVGWLCVNTEFKN